MTRRKNQCPACGSGDLVPIVYGYPSEQMLGGSRSGEISLGGCIVAGDDPERICHRCGASVYGDGRFSFTDEEQRWTAVELPVTSRPDIDVSLRAELATDGTLRLAGHDVGPGVEEIWGDFDYEYWLTIEPEHLPAVIGLLFQERLADHEDVQSLLDDYANFRVEGSVEGLGSYSPGRSAGGYLNVELDQSEPIAVEPQVVLFLLRDLFAAATFHGTSGLRSWLDERGVPSEFFSYA